MGEQASQGGFSFRCSAKDPRHDPEAGLGRLHNPWPLLAPSGGLEYVRSNPLVRAFYSPVDLRPVLAIRERRQAMGAAERHQRTTSDLADFRDWLIWSHETAHLYYLDWTPAKEMAKTYLAKSYAAILDLLFRDELVEERIAANWAYLKRLTYWLGQIEKSIVFVEELIATAIALRAMKEQTQDGGLWTGFAEELEEIEEEFVDQDDYLPGFREAYRRVAPLVELMYGSSRFVSLLIPLLQPIRFGSEPTDLPSALDTRARLRVILDLLDGIADPLSAVERLRHLIEDEGSGWRVALGLQLDEVRNPLSEENDFTSLYNAMARRLWRISRDELEVDVANDAFPTFRIADAIRSQILAGKRLGPNGLVTLQPRVHGGRKYICQGEWLDRAEDPAGRLQIEHRTVLFCEGLRQQILAGKGIICPHNADGTRRCHCAEPIRQSLERLADAARGGAFGRGEWTRLPCRP